MKNWAKKKYKKNEVYVTKSQQSLCKTPFNWAFLGHGLKSNGEMQRFSTSFSAFVSICMAFFKVFLSTFWKKDGIYLTFWTKNYLSFKLNIDVHSFMLLKASKSILTIFKQYFCENPSKLVSLADFVTQKKRTSFYHIFQ